MLSTQYQFSFYKKAHAQASCSYSVIGTLQRPLGRGSLGVQVSQALYLTIFIGQYTRFIHNAPPQSVCCSYSLQHRNASLQDRSKQAAGCVCEKVCSRVCLYEQHKKKQFNKKKGSMHKFTTLHYTCTPMPVFSFVASHSITYTIQLQSYLCKAGIMLDCGHKHSFYTLLVSPKHTCTLSVLQCTACATTLAMTSCLGHLKIVLLFLYFV